MRKLDFAKTHGLGNDFIIVNGLDEEFNGLGMPNLAASMCDRNFGIGADGLILVLPSATADYKMRIINSDGSEAEMCGNGVRCFAKYLFDREMVGEVMSVETLSGVKNVEVFSGDGIGLAFMVNMGVPELTASKVPVISNKDQVIAMPLEVYGETYEITCVSTGVPHCVIFVNSVDDIPLDRLGPVIEAHPIFPRKTNVEFAQVISREEIKVRVWERGAGITLACGTGACATVVAGALNDLANRKATVHLPGGDLFIDWDSSGEVYMTGPAQEVYTGVYCV